MSRRIVLAAVLVASGGVAILVGVSDPIEGMFLILPGSGMIAAGAFLAQTPRRRLVYWGFLLIVISICAVLAISSRLNGLPGLWALFLLPYPVGWLMDVVGVPYALTALFKGKWVAIAVGFWLVAAAALLVRLILLIIQVRLVSPWIIPAVIGLSCLCILAVYVTERPTDANPAKTS